MSLINITDFIKGFKPEVNWDTKAKKLAKDKGVSINDVKDEWEKKKQKGIYIHSNIQEELKKDPECIYSGDVNSRGITGNYEPIEEKLKNGLYLEKPIISIRHGLVGVPDKIYIHKNTINVEDFKTFEKIYRTSPSIKIGSKYIKEKMAGPLSELDNCNYIDTVLQLSLYMRLLWESNRDLKVGKLYMTHVIADDNNKILEKNTEEVPYLREEVQNLLKYKKERM